MAQPRGGRGFAASGTAAPARIGVLLTGTLLTGTLLTSPGPGEHLKAAERRQEERRMRAAMLTVFWASLLLTLASFGGELHGLGDSLAVFRHWWAVLVSLSSLLLLRGRLRLAGLGLLAGFLAGAPVLAGWFGGGGASGGEERYAFYQKNLLYNGTDRRGIIADIRATAPDFVSMQEISDANLEIYEALAEAYPTRLICSSRGAGRLAILSRYPLSGEDPARCLKPGGVAAVRVATPDGPVWALALHLKWPFPRAQAEQVATMLPALRDLDAPVVLGGDFNMVPWSATMRRIEAATGSRRAGALFFTFRHPRFPLWLPIDHLLVPGGRGRLEIRPFLGSDHRGLLLRFGLDGPSGSPGR